MCRTLPFLPSSLCSSPSTEDSKNRRRWRKRTRIVRSHDGGEVPVPSPEPCVQIQSKTETVGVPVVPRVIVEEVSATSTHTSVVDVPLSNYGQPPPCVYKMGNGVGRDGS